jgi:5-methylcytosine-specific restriction endonuclease McrA
MSVLIPCTACGRLVERETARRGRCSACARKANRTRSRRRYARTGNRYSHAYRKARQAVLKRDGYRCRYCGAPATTVDHVVPRSRGGSDDPTNLVAACARCNRAKGAGRDPGAKGGGSSFEGGSFSTPAGPAARKKGRLRG